MDPVSSHIGAGTLGAAALYAWVKAGPVLMAKLTNGNGNGKTNGYESASLELKMQSVVERVAGSIIAPIIASMSRVEGALTRMEATQNNMNSTLSAMAAADQARALGDLRQSRHGD